MTMLISNDNFPSAAARGYIAKVILCADFAKKLLPYKRKVVKKYKEALKHIIMKLYILATFLFLVSHPILLLSNNNLFM